MTKTIPQYLNELGPSRSSLIVEAMAKDGISAPAARQRISRAGDHIRRFPIPMLPKREAFIYLQKDRNSERFWLNFIRDMRASGSVYSAAIDGMIARGGLIPAYEFPTISGAPVIPQKGQLHVDVVSSRLQAADFMKEVWYDDKLHFELAFSLASGTPVGMRARDLTERVLLDGLREWCRKIGLASYNSICVRGDPDLRPIGPFAFDLAGPSYLLPLQGGPSMPGFIVADVFAEGILTVHEIQYFIRKARMLKATLGKIGVLSIILAEGFTGEAMTAGHKAGVILATPKDLFGRRVGAAVSSLCEVLKNAAAYASSSPERLTLLLDNLFDIEGRNRNIRGVLFELVAGYLARRDAVSIEMNLTARDSSTGKTAEIDVQKVAYQGRSVTAIECKGKEPGGVLSKEEVQKWLGKVAIIRAHYRAHYSLREAEHRFEIWTSGTIAPDALELLQDEKAKRVKTPIDWKDGQRVLELARADKEKGIADALYQHFINHPLAKAADELAANAASIIAAPALTERVRTAPALPPPADDFVALGGQEAAE
ncbi:MAG: hypothetical protein H6921_07415 [Sphingomonas sp.]|nr:hypothetical protein [Sphingomonas sp.]